MSDAIRFVATVLGLSAIVIGIVVGPAAHSLSVWTAILTGFGVFIVGLAVSSRHP